MPEIYFLYPVVCGRTLQTIIYKCIYVLRQSLCKHLSFLSSRLFCYTVKKPCYHNKIMKAIQLLPSYWKKFFDFSFNLRLSKHTYHHTAEGLSQRYKGFLFLKNWTFFVGVEGFCWNSDPVTPQLVVCRTIVLLVLFIIKTHHILVDFLVLWIVKLFHKSW